MKESPFDMYVRMYNGKLPTENDPNYLELLKMSKYRILQVPDVQPGKCANCGASKNDGRRYIDIGLDIQWYGALMLCGLCLKDIATEFGLFKDLEHKLEVLQSEYTKTLEIEESGMLLQKKLLQGFEEVKDYYSKLHSLGNDSSSYSGSVGIPDEKPSVETKSGSDKPTRASNTRASKPPSSSGPKDLRSLTDIINAES